MKESELKEMIEDLMDLLIDCKESVDNARDCQLIDRIDNAWEMLEGISESIGDIN